VDQYLAVIEQARGLRLEIQADWLVMAAWLAWLKSRLLLPKEETGRRRCRRRWPERLTDRLAALGQMRAGAAWLGARPQLNREVFPAARRKA
jgi:segregation and condensation protein A